MIWAQIVNQADIYEGYNYEFILQKQVKLWKVEDCDYKVSYKNNFMLEFIFIILFTKPCILAYKTCIDM